MQIFANLAKICRGQEGPVTLPKNGTTMIIIPDVHGRTFWRQAVNEYLGKEHILFLGDYLDPYAYEGIDGELANMQFLTLEDIYIAATEKITQYKCNSFAEYAKNNYRSEIK